MRASCRRLAGDGFRWIAEKNCAAVAPVGLRASQLSKVWTKSIRTPSWMIASLFALDFEVFGMQALETWEGQMVSTAFVDLARHRDSITWWRCRSPASRIPSVSNSGWSTSSRTLVLSFADDLKVLWWALGVERVGCNFYTCEMKFQGPSRYSAHEKPEFFANFKILCFPPGRNNNGNKKLFDIYQGI